MTTTAEGLAARERVYARTRAAARPPEPISNSHEPERPPPPEDEPEATPADEPRAGTRIARVTWAFEITPEPVLWAWDDGGGRIAAGTLVMAAGREGTGKSSAGIWIAAQISNGTLPGAWFGTPRRVLYVAVEDSWRHTLVPRFMAAGADLARIGRFDVVTDTGDDGVTLSLPADNGLLEAEVIRHGVALVLIDPLMSVIGEKVDTHRERDTRTALDPLAQLADRTGSVLLGIAHFNKGAGTDAASLITGSGAFKNVPRAVFGFARDDTEEGSTRVMTQVKNSLGRDDLPSLSYRLEGCEVPTPTGPAQTSRFVFEGTSERTVADLLRDSRGDADDRSDQGEAGTWLLDYLSHHGDEASAGEVMKAGAADGFAKHTLQRARRRVGVVTRKGGLRSGWVWAITASEDDAKVTKATGHSGLSSSSSSPSPSASDEEACAGPAPCFDCSEPATASDLDGKQRCQTHASWNPA